ncbi:MAG: hypothetical protein LBU39_05910 [Desulfobulbaceae bacterium]|jgi:hypothetical protein|nr:hypothetical protein [Desulfobulbaceae bacterium]
MNKQQETPEQSAEMRKVIEEITTALIKSGQEARKLAEMTGTPLVVRNSKTQANSKIGTGEAISI